MDGGERMSDKICYCYRCQKWFSPDENTKHLATHERKKETCIVRYIYGNKKTLGPQSKEKKE